MKTSGGVAEDSDLGLTELWEHMVGQNLGGWTDPRELQGVGAAWAES